MVWPPYELTEKQIDRQTCLMASFLGQPAQVRWQQKLVKPFKEARDDGVAVASAGP